MEAEQAMVLPDVESPSDDWRDWVKRAEDVLGITDLRLRLHGDDVRALEPLVPAVAVGLAKAYEQGRNS